MITKLTKKQELKIPEYFEKWNKIAFDNKAIDRKKAKMLLKKYLGFIDIKPEIFLFLDSPMTCELAINILKNIGDSQLYSQLCSQLHSQLDSQLCSQLCSQLYSQLDSQLCSQLHSQLHLQLHLQLCSQLHSQLHLQLCSQLHSQLHLQLDLKKKEYYSLEWFYQSGNICSGYCCFYDYLGSELISLDKKTNVVFDIFKNITKELHFFFVFEKIVFISEKPKYIKYNSNNQLHCESGPSVEYGDGYSMYNLNGVLVNRNIVETSFDRLDARLLLSERNAEVRREIVRKIGIERICKDLGAQVIEKGTDQIGQPCELLKLDIGDGNKRPYLKMINPSIGTYHIEGVPPGCDTIEKAFNSRKPKVIRDIPINDKGKNWYQQGDVYIWPKNVKSLKKNPKILT